MTVKTRKKLIEVALPLDAINKASAREKSIRHGHPSTLHLWWARRPLAAARAVIFSQMVDDPSQYVEELREDAKLRRKAEGLLKGRLKQWEEARVLFEKAEGTGLDVPEPGPQPTLDDVLADQERDRLFRIIEELVKWENTTNEAVLNAARADIWRSWRRTCADNADQPRAAELFDPQRLPPFHDPFAGGGSLPLEAQRLGLEAYATDLNPVAVLINKAMIEIPPKFGGLPPVNPESRQDKRLVDKAWKGVEGLAEDVRCYGKWMRDEAEKRIGHLYPKVEISAEMAEERPDLQPLVGQKLTVIAWLWTRTVASPDPAFRGVHVPLIASYWLCKKPGRTIYLDPVTDREQKSWGYRVRTDIPVDAEAVSAGTKTGRGAFRCILSGAPMNSSYLHEQGQQGQIKIRLVAVIVAGERGRVYVDATPQQEEIASMARPDWMPDTRLGTNTRHLTPVVYGYETHASLYTPRQLTCLTTLASLVSEARARVYRHAETRGDRAADSYAEAVALMLGLAVSRRQDKWSSFSIWNTIGEKIETLIRLSAIPMTWEFAEGNPFSNSTGNFLDGVELTAKAFESLGLGISGKADQGDARALAANGSAVVCTDPPYFDNVPYADLSDLFYIWLRRTLRPIFPELLATVLVPKQEELVADPHRHQSKAAAEQYFLQGMRDVLNRLRAAALPQVPLTIFYAFKQSESRDEGQVSTGWDTFLSALTEAGFSIVGTWPVRTERPGGLRNAGRNSLATSVVLVCRPRPDDAPTTTRRDLVHSLRTELPRALTQLQRGNIAPVDLAQASIGPGMAVFSRYGRVLDAEGQPLTVREALALINQVLDEVLAEQEGDFDADSRWALTWFEEAGFGDGEFGRAEQLSKAKNTSVGGLEQAGIISTMVRGKVRILKPHELPADWDPSTDPRLTTWEMVHHLIRALESGGEPAAATIAHKLGSKAEVARELCYRLYAVCERKKRSLEGISYNSLVQSWPEIMRLAQESAPGEQGALFAESGV